MRNYEEFKEALVENMKHRLGEAAEISIHTVIKNQSEEEKITIRFADAKTAPSINLETLYEDYKNHEEVDTVADRLESYLSQVPNIEVPILTLQEAKENVFFQLISKEANGELLQQSLYTEVPDTDLVLICRWKCSNDGSFIVKHGLAEHLGFSEEDLLLYAADNTARMKWSLQSILQAMLGLTEEVDLDSEMMVDMDVPMKVLTNESKMYGASVITIPGCLKEVHEKLQKNFYILPSSIHETLILPEEEDADVNFLAQMVRDINATEVAPTDRLSDHVYYFDGEKISIAQ